MAKQSDFNKFLSNIEPSSSTVSYISSIQTNLRTYLRNQEDYEDIHIDTFCQVHMQNILLFVQYWAIKSEMLILL